MSHFSVNRAIHYAITMLSKLFSWVTRILDSCTIEVCSRSNSCFIIIVHRDHDVRTELLA